MSILFLFALFQSVHFQSVVNMKGLDPDQQVTPTSASHEISRDRHSGRGRAHKQVCWPQTHRALRYHNFHCSPQTAIHIPISTCSQYPHTYIFLHTFKDSIKVHSPGAQEEKYGDANILNNNFVKDYVTFKASLPSPSTPMLP